jgi:O-antigen ligase
MKSIHARQSVGPGFLFLSMLLGGSVQSIRLNAVLQLIAILLIAWALVEKKAAPINQQGRQLLRWAVVPVVLVLLYLIPIPAFIWSPLPGRMPIALGFEQLGLHPSWQPMSVAPYDTITAGLTLLPPIAMIAVIVRLRAYSKTGLVAAMLLGAALGVGLGIVQLESGSENYYLQAEHNAGTASGFFANPNHMATLLLMCIPFLAAIVRNQMDESSLNPRRTLGIIVAAMAGVVLAVLGLVLNRSGAGIALAVPVVLLSAMIVKTPPLMLARPIIAVAVLSALAFVCVLVVPVGKGMPAKMANSVATRQEFLSTGLKVAGDYFPFGSGIGTFAPVYRLREDVQTLDLTAYVNHAHDDYLETLIEAGLLGIVLVVMFLIWFGRNCWRAVRQEPRDPIALAGGIAAATVLLHSVVDYPLRTSALSVLFAVSLGMLIRARNDRDLGKGMRSARHIKIGA